jgi:hypothetical protein
LGFHGKASGYWENYLSERNSVLIVGKGEGGGKLDQGSDDDDPGDHNQQHEQGVDDEAATGSVFDTKEQSKG